MNKWMIWGYHYFWVDTHLNFFACFFLLTVLFCFRPKILSKGDSAGFSAARFSQQLLDFGGWMEVGNPPKKNIGRQGFLTLKSDSFKKEMQMFCEISGLQWCSSLFLWLNFGTWIHSAKWWCFFLPVWSFGRLQHISGKRNVNSYAPKCRCKNAATWMQSSGTCHINIKYSMYDTPRIFQHNPGAYPRPSTNTLSRNSFIWGFGDAWGMLQGYVGFLVEIHIFMYSI